MIKDFKSLDVFGKIIVVALVGTVCACGVAFALGAAMGLGFLM